MSPKTKKKPAPVYCKCSRKTWPPGRRLGTCQVCWWERPPLTNEEIDAAIERGNAYSS